MFRRLLQQRLVVVGLIFLTACRSAKAPVVAKVGNSTITLEEVQSRLRQTPAAYQQYAATPEGRRQFLDILIREKILLGEARKSGLQNDPSYHQAVDRFQKDWKHQLEDYKESVLVDSYLKRLRVKELAVTDAEVARFYSDHRSDFENPAELQVSHILASSEPDAEAALTRLKRGESFETVAQALSKDPSTAAQGGRLAPFRRGSLPPEFENAAFALRAGEISPIVKTQFGFHIIKKLGEHHLPAQTLEQAKENIRARLERDKFNEWITARQASLGVHVDEPLMSRVSSPPQEPSSL